MKKTLLAIAILACALSAKSQNVYYKPFSPNSPQNQEQQKVSIVRANAYYESSGQYYKLPIKVAISEAGQYYNPQSVKVVSYYAESGYQGVWRDLTIPAYVTKCNSLYGDALEKQFMYKANVGGEIVYFDL